MYPSYFSNKYLINVSLFMDVTNSNEIRKQLLDGTLNVAFIKAKMVVDSFHILAAANKALLAHLSGKQVTKTLHSEILYCLSPNKHISDCFRRFGIDDSDTSLLAVEICEPGNSCMDRVTSLVQGHQVSLDELGKVNSVKDIQKLYKVKDAELSVGSLTEAVVARMATKEFVSVS